MMMVNQGEWDVEAQVPEAAVRIQGPDDAIAIPVEVEDMLLYHRLSGSVSVSKYAVRSS